MTAPAAWGRRLPPARWRHRLSRPRGVANAARLRHALAMTPRPPSTDGTRHGVARVLSKLGLCSRSEAGRRVAAGRVRVNGRVVSDPEFPVRIGIDRVELDAGSAQPAPPCYLMLNKPRGLVTTTADERGRDTVYRCLDGAGLPWLAPVGRLDRASEGLLLFCNDPGWAARITDPATGPSKTYHVQVDRVPEETLLQRLEQGAMVDGERLSARSVRLLRAGAKNAWLEIVLDEGRNRQIRRLLAHFDIAVLRLLRVAIGPLVLGGLAKGAWRALTPAEVAALAGE
jgi:23S rRNA pseudouridine2605 synthase